MQTARPAGTQPDATGTNPRAARNHRDRLEDTTPACRAGSMSRVAVRHTPAPALVSELLSPVVERGLRNMLLGTEPRHRQPATREPLQPLPPLGELRGTR